MSRPYRLDVRLAVIVTAVSALTLFTGGMVLMLEFRGEQFAIEERGLSSQVEDWVALVQRKADGSVVFERPAETTQDLDPPYTGLLTGARPIYGYAVADADGRVLGGTFRLDRSEHGCRFVMTFLKVLPNGDAP